MKTTRIDGLIITVILPAMFILPACPSDSGAQPWDDFEPTDAGVDLRDADRDGGETDVRDAADAADTSDALDTTDSGPDGTSEGRDIVVFPEQPAQSAQCNADDWCWIHPSPFPYRIEELQRDGDRLLGVARTELRGDFQLFTWDGQTMDLVDLGGVDASALEDITPADGGWLSVSSAGEGEAYWHGLDGTSQRVFTDGRSLGYDRITGNSPDEFILSGVGGAGLLMHQGDSKHFMDLPGTGRPVMWPNNEVWNVDEQPGEVSQTPLSIEWHSLPVTDELQRNSPDALGPSPTSDCAGRIIGHFGSQGFVEWPDRDTPPMNISVKPYSANDIACGWNDEVMVLGYDGRYMQGISDGAQWNRFPSGRLYAAATLGETTYAGGEFGAFYGLSDDGVDAIHRGFRPRGDYFGQPQYSSLWVNRTETKAVLTHGSRTSFGNAQGWQQVPARESEGVGSAFRFETTEIWGIDQPEFAISADQIYRWEHDPADGPRWVDAGLEHPESPYYEEFVDISGRSRNEVWVATYASLFRYDGEGWREVSPDVVEAQTNDIGAIRFDADGDLLVADSDHIYELTVSDEGWSPTAISESPCEKPSAIDRDNDGALLVAGRGLCVARRSNGTWSTFSLPDSVTAPTDSTIELERAWEFVRQPGTRPMMVATSLGLFELQKDGTLKREFVGNTLEAEYLPMSKAVWVLTTQGVLGRYY
jgi:hypothetical protein